MNLLLWLGLGRAVRHVVDDLGFDDEAAHARPAVGTTLGLRRLEVGHLLLLGRRGQPDNHPAAQFGVFGKINQGHRRTI